MSFYKHTGLHNAQPIFVVLHQMPDPAEGHMALILFRDKLPSAYSEAVVKCLNTPEAQAAKNFADALEKTSLPDGRNLAKVLYTEGHLKKVPTNQVFVTPDSRNKIKLNDLNEYLTRIEEGGEALKKLEAMDKGRGMSRYKKDAKNKEARETVVTVQESTGSMQQVFEQLSLQVAQLSATVENLSQQVAVAPKKAAKRAVKKAVK